MRQISEQRAPKKDPDKRRKRYEASIGASDEELLTLVNVRSQFAEEKRMTDLSECRNENDKSDPNDYNAQLSMRSIQNKATPSIHASATSRSSNIEECEADFSNKVHNRRSPWWLRNPCHPQKVMQFILEDWLFLVVLGTSMALFSLIVDICISNLHNLHIRIMDIVSTTGDAAINTILTYIAWMSFTITTMMSSVIFVHFVSPKAIGSGVPEMKTILRGIPLKDCLTVRTLIAKIVGLVLAIGSGFPIGKEGPFVHVGSITAHIISSLERNFKPPAYTNESRRCEMLAAGFAAGVACTFSAPIGGVLFSIEVMAVYFAVREYWRGFFAAACGSILFSLLRLCTTSSGVTITTFYQTYFKPDSYYPEELIIFTLLGCFNGLIGAIFISLHRHLVLFLRKNKLAKIFQTNWLIYPLFVSVVYSTITCPKGIGKYITGEVVFSRTLREFFINCTWNAPPFRSEACHENFTERWSADESIFIELTVFIFGFYFLALVASTLPVPGGIFMPMFVIGGGIGRLIGELMVVAFPYGLRRNPLMPIYPGIYSVVGAASLCGAVTRTVSVAMITFELTGQIVHIFPVLIAVVIANITSSSFQPSFFDSIIKVKHLPYLPDMPKATSEVHAIRAEQIMVRNVVSLSKRCTYRDIQKVLAAMPRLHAFPVVDHPESKVLLGSISRANLLRLWESQMGDARWKEEAMRLASDENEDIVDNDMGGQSKLKLPLFSDPRKSTILSEISRTTVPIKRTKTGCNLHSLHEQRNRSNSLNAGHVALKNLATFRLHRSALKRPVGLFDDDRRLWECKQLRSEINLPSSMLDSAPFQLVQSTSLYKVHSLFSLLGVRRAYVTECGVLVGVVALSELRNAIEHAQAGDLRPHQRFAHVAVDAHWRSGDEMRYNESVVYRNECDSGDYDDCILPRVEVEETLESPYDLERKISALQTESGAVAECLKREDVRTSRV